MLVVQPLFNYSSDALPLGGDFVTRRCDDEDSLDISDGCTVSVLRKPSFPIKYDLGFSPAPLAELRSHSVMPFIPSLEWKPPCIDVHQVRWPCVLDNSLQHSLLCHSSSSSCRFPE